MTKSYIVLKRENYRDHWIYIRQYGSVFEYLVAIKGEIYSHHVIIKPDFFRLFRKNKYSDETIKDVVGMLKTAAIEVIEKVLE